MVFVTGGTGLVGSRLIFDLVNKGEKVVALIRPQTSTNKFIELIDCYTDNTQEINSKVEWVEGDLLDFDRLFEIIPENSQVYHCAAEISFNSEDKDVINSTNIEGTANVVNVCIEKKISKLCFVSSIGAIGKNIVDDIVNEDTPWTPFGKSAYSLSKYYAEMEVWRGVAEGLNAVIVNPAVILGAGNWQKGSSRLFTTVHKGVKYYTKGTTGYVDVRDVSKSMIMLMNSDISGERFLLSATVLSIKELFTKIAETLNVKPPYKYATPIITNIAYRIGNIKKIIFRVEPKITKQTHKISHSINNYSGKKIKERLNFEYINIDDTINFVGKCFIDKYYSKK
jgi:nucleoside-diphosphate-sugar epimerase